MRSGLCRAAILRIITKVVCEFKALLKQLRHPALSVRDLIADHKLAVHAHVINRVQLNIRKWDLNILRLEGTILSCCTGTALSVTRRHQAFSPPISIFVELSTGCILVIGLLTLVLRSKGADRSERSSFVGDKAVSKRIKLADNNGIT